MAGVSLYLSIITLIVNKLNASIKRHRTAKNVRPNYMLPTRDTLQLQGHTKQRDEKIIRSSGSQKRVRVAILYIRKKLTLSKKW